MCKVSLIIVYGPPVLALHRWFYRELNFYPASVENHIRTQHPSSLRPDQQLVALEIHMSRANASLHEVEKILRQMGNLQARSSFVKASDP